MAHYNKQRFQYRNIFEYLWIEHRTRSVWSSFDYSDSSSSLRIVSSSEGGREIASSTILLPVRWLVCRCVSWNTAPSISPNTSFATSCCLHASSGHQIVPSDKQNLEKKDRQQKQTSTRLSPLSANGTYLTQTHYGQKLKDENQNVVGKLRHRRQHQIRFHFAMILLFIRVVLMLLFMLLMWCKFGLKQNIAIVLFPYHHIFQNRTQSKPWTALMGACPKRHRSCLVEKIHRHSSVSVVQRCSPRFESSEISATTTKSSFSISNPSVASRSARGDCLPFPPSLLFFLPFLSFPFFAKIVFCKTIEQLTPHNRPTK